MPANRSRTENFHTALADLQLRGGSIEVRIAAPANAPAALYWRVRLLRVAADHLVVSPPSAAGADMPFSDGVRLEGAYSIGQNRWTFSTSVLSHAGASATSGCLVLAMPDRVQRCPRRAHDRLDTPARGSAGLPRVECWPLLDPASVAPAEVAHAQVLVDRLAASTSLAPTLAPSTPLSPEAADSLKPAVGPCIAARLLNLSGGGLGLTIAASDAPALERHAFIWARLHLAPQLPAPLAVTLRRLHSHLDSSGEVYLGACFDFAFHTAHQAFVASMLAQYTRGLQSSLPPSPRRAAA